MKLHTAMKTNTLAFVLPYLLCVSTASLTGHLSHFQQIPSVQSRTGYTLARCISDTQCLDDRQCYDTQSDDDGKHSKCGPSSETCSCRDSEVGGDLIVCISSSLCELGDRCVMNGPGKLIGLCVSCQVAAVLRDNGKFCFPDEDTSNCVGDVPDALSPLCTEFSITKLQSTHDLTYRK